MCKGLSILTNLQKELSAEYEEDFVPVLVRKLIIVLSRLMIRQCCFSTEDDSLTQ